VKAVVWVTAFGLALQCGMAFPAYSADLSVAGVVLQDNRPAARKKNYRGGPFAPTAAMGDDALTPSGLVRFQEALKKNASADGPIDLLVNDFAVIDYFPRRLSVIAEGGLLGAFVREKMKSDVDWTMVENLGLPPDGEAIICLFTGEVNGEPATVATFSTYDSSSGGGKALIRNMDVFKEAVDLAIEKAAKQALEGT
jgi:hypothetical protein